MGSKETKDGKQLSKAQIYKDLQWSENRKMVKSKIYMFIIYEFEKRSAERTPRNPVPTPRDHRFASVWSHDAL